MTTYNIPLDIHQVESVIPEMVRGRTGDTDIRIVATISNSGAAYDLTGKTVRFEAQKPDKTWIRDSSPTVSGSTITYDCPAGLFAAAGLMRNAYFIIVSGSEETSTSSFYVMALPNAEAGASTPSETYVSDIAALIAQQQSNITAAQAAATASQAHLDALIADYTTGEFIKPTDYATTSKAGIVKPDGTTITVDTGGKIHGAGVTLNGTQNSSPSFYAPITAGAAGKVLTSGGTGVAPAWSDGSNVTKEYVDEQVATLEDSISPVKQAVTRTIVGETTATGSKTLPASFDHLEIRATYTPPGGSTATIFAVVPRWALSTTAIRPTFGYCATTTGACNGMLLNISTTSLHLEFLYDSQTDCTASAHLTIYAVG